MDNSYLLSRFVCFALAPIKLNYREEEPVLDDDEGGEYEHSGVHWPSRQNL